MKIRRATRRRRHSEATAAAGWTVDLSAVLGAPAGTWRLVETEPGAWGIHRGGAQVGIGGAPRPAAAARGWLARLTTGVELPARGDLAAPGSALWRTRDLAAAGI